MNDSREFQDAESVRSGQSHVTSQPVFFPPHPNPGGMLSRSLGMSSRNNGPPSIWDTHRISDNVFCRSNGVFFSTLSVRVRRSLLYRNTHHHMWWGKATHQFRIRDASQDRQPEIQSSLVREDFQRIMVQTNNDCRSQIFFGKFPTPATFVSWQIRFKTEVCTCSQFYTEAMLRIKEVEMVDSVDDLKSSCSVRGIRMPDSEVLDAKIAPALNRIIHNTQFKRNVSLWRNKQPKKRTVSFEVDRSLTWSTSTSRSLEPTILSRIMPTYSLLVFEMTIFRNSIRFEMGWNFIINDEIPPDDILEGLYKIRNTRVWETQDRIGIVRPGDSSEESWTWLSQIEDNGEKKYRTESTNQEFTKQEFGRQIWKLWEKRRGQESRDKTACTKNSWRLLAMEIQRAVF